MFSGMLQAGTKALGGARFSLVNLMPAALFVTSVAILIASGAYAGRKPSLTHLFSEIDKNPGLAVAGAFGIFLIAVLLRPFQVALVQFLEGYWQRWRSLRLAEDLATERHRRLLHTAARGSCERPAQPASSEFRDVADYAQRRRKFRRIQGRAKPYSRPLYPRPLCSGATMTGSCRHFSVMCSGTARTMRGADMASSYQNVYPRMYPSLSPKARQRYQRPARRAGHDVRSLLHSVRAHRSACAAPPGTS